MIYRYCPGRGNNSIIIDTTRERSNHYNELRAYFGGAGGQPEEEVVDQVLDVGIME